jgi:hypothetical protein
MARSPKPPQSLNVALRVSTGGTVEDWVDHYGAPRAQLRTEMPSEVLSFALNVVGRHLRFSETQGQLVLEWRIGDDWCQCVPALRACRRLTN